MKIIGNKSRSIYRFRYPVKGSFNLGEICPIGSVIEVYPYDEFKIDMGMIIRMATPIAPIMDDLDAEITAHFVPLRLIGNPTYGDITFSGQTSNNNDLITFEKVIANGLGNPADWMRSNSEAFNLPTTGWSPYEAKNADYTTIGEALGLGLGIGNNQNEVQVSALPLMGYNLIYQERFRNQNVETTKTSLLKGSNLYGKSGKPTDTTDTDSTSYNQCLSVAYKHNDYFTAAVPSPTKGGAIEISLGEEAPVHVRTGSTMINQPYGLTILNPSSGANDISLATGAGNLKFTYPDSASSWQGTGSMFADLTNATSATINSFIDAYNVQRLLMKDIKGTRYFDIIKNHYGVENEDIKLYIPQLLSYKRFAINISPVVQQSGAASSESGTEQGNFLGTTGGYSMTATKGSLVHHAFGEFGYIYFLIVIRQKHTYGQGIPKLFKRLRRFDFFWEELGRIGYQAIENSELDANDTTGDVYGYEPAWEELRRVNFGQTFGFLNPNKANSLDYWTLTNKLENTPLLEMAFLKENRNNLARALTIADQGPDFIMDSMIYGTKSTLVPIGTEPKLFN